MLTRRLLLKSSLAAGALTGLLPRQIAGAGSGSAGACAGDAWRPEVRP